jgi:tetratricopeptide (TPR) repeat protein
MIVRKLILGVLLVVVMAGCKTSLRSNWRNFNAYYNTYYNAKKSYEAGLKKNLGQNRDYNPLQPIRIHLKPVNAGAQDFDKAIQKGADVLRRYDDTKWVDNAIALIGKSYYFRQEYFSADQKFNELLLTTENPEMQQEAIKWQGRVLLDMELYNEGVAFLSEQLTLLDDEWKKGIKAEVKALLAEHYVGLENWQVAANELEESLPDLPKKEYKERGYFLLGQINELLGNTEAAFDAYNKVQSYYVEYRVQYLAKRKKAEVARSLNRYDVAYDILNDMVRDDKNLEYKAELDFELAQNEQQRENYKKAEALYNDVLHNKLHRPAPEIAARSYNGLAEIYRFGYVDFSTAAAYYDSAAQKNVPTDKLPDDFNAKELAESFGNYARIKNQITLQDSLLRLGRLSPAAFDSALAEIRKKKIAELERLREKQERQQNQLVTVNQEQKDQDASASTNNGFLNENNPVVQQNVRQQFFAIWGDRPLADNWRVRSMISISAGANQNGAADQEGAEQTGGTKLVTVEIDLSAIPFKPSEQDSVLRKISAYKYELGNLFFLSLDDPDSAAFYFHKAIEGPSNQDINTVSLYSLSELSSIQGDEEQARKYALRLVENYPNTEYAHRVAEKYELKLTENNEEEAVNPIELYEQILGQDSITTIQKASRLKQLAFDYESHRIAPQALLEAIQIYMKDGKKAPAYQKKFDELLSLNQEWDHKQKIFNTEKDSARKMLNDTTLTQEERSGYQALLDSTLTPPNFIAVFPYRGADWDSARAAADTFLVLFPKANLQPKVTRIKNELKVPQEKKKIEPVEEPKPEMVADAGNYLSCKEVGGKLEIRGGMDSYMDTIQLPENDAGLTEIIYVFKVNQRGIAEGHTLQTKEVPENIQAAFEQAFEKPLSFEPILYEGQAVAVECPVSFPLAK